MAIGIGGKAIEAGYQLLFRNARDLAEALELPAMEGELEKTFHEIARLDAPVIDEFGIC